MGRSAEEIAREAAELDREVRDGRYVKAYRGRSYEMIKSFDRHARDVGFGPTGWSPGRFLKSVANCYKNHSGNWSADPEMKAYGDHMLKAYDAKAKQLGYVEKGVPTGMNELQGPDGGYLVPPEFSQQLLMRTYDNDLLSRCTTLPMTSNLLVVPAINETSRLNGSRFGGVQALWAQESQTLTESKPGFAGVEIKPDTVTLLMRASNQFLEDASYITVEQWLSMISEEELNFKVGDGIVNGSGTDQMQGILNCPSLISVAAQTGQASHSINAVNNTEMWRRLHQSCRKNAVWLIDQSIETQLMQMTIGNAGAQLAVYLPPGGLSDKPYGTLLGRPVLTTEFGQQLGTRGDIILADLTTYLVGLRQAMVAATSIHVAFSTNEQMFRFVMRLGGRSWWTSALTPKSNGDTQSNVIVLAAR